MTETQTRTKLLKMVFQELRNVKLMLADARRTIPHPPEHQPLNRAQFDIVIAITRSEKPLTMSELSAALCVTPGAVTQLVDSLVEQGMLERHQNEDDRRSTTVGLTEHAHNKVASVERHFITQLTPYFNEFSTQDLQTFQILLSKMRKS